MTDNANDIQERQRLYERTRDELAANVRSVSESLDRSLLTLSSAFLGGSLAFIGQVVELRRATGIWFLYSAWFLFTLTIILTIASFIYGLHQYRALSDAAKRYYVQGDLKAWEVSDKEQRATIRLTDIYGVSFILGILLLIVFVSINLKNAEVVMSPERIQKSIPPSTFQQPAPQQPTTGSTSEPATPVNPGDTPQPAPQQPATQTNQGAKKGG